ncbi:MAG: lycopene cyclase domain-containing protein [Sporichthyaceae bacterium]
MTYTQAAVLGAVAVLAFDVFGGTRLVRQPVFWASYAIVVFFQLLSNGWLTGRRIVRYDADAILGDAEPTFLGDGRIVYAPVEDLLFGFALVLWTWIWWERFGQDRRARR